MEISSTKEELWGANGTFRRGLPPDWDTNSTISAPAPAISPRQTLTGRSLELRWGGDTPFSFRAQVGPVISSSSSGSFLTTGPMGQLSSTSVPAKTQIDFGYLVSGDYRDRRLTVTASASQQPEFGAGFAFATSVQSYGILVSYNLSRRATAFFNGGYYTSSGNDISEEALAYTVGITYHLNKYLTLSANYLGFQTKASGSAVLGTVAVPGARTTTNLFQVGITFAPPPLKWRPYSSRERK